MFTTLILAAAMLAADPAAETPVTPSETLLDGAIEKVAGGFGFTEGPVYVPALGTVLFSDIPNDRIHRLDTSEVFREPSGQSNGLLLDGEERLLAAEHKNRRVTRTEPDGTVTVLAERWEDKRFNSPNDLIVRGDGVVFFTDPPYGLEGGLGGPNADLDFSGVYAILADGSVKLLINDFQKPNGIALSPDEKTLYVADTDGGHIRAFDVAEDATLSNGRELCKLMFPDGMVIDEEGRLWATGGKSVNVFSPEGELIERIDFPEIPANCTFGGEDRKTLYATARNSVYAVKTKTAGLAPPYIQE
jgi:gluconolactonase